MSEKNQFLLYTAPDGTVKVEVVMKNETVWLTQKALAELFGVKVPAINKHLKNIFDSGELTPGTTVSKMEIVRAEGRREVSREVEFYNLDAIIAVGYRVNSHQAGPDDVETGAGRKNPEVRCQRGKKLPERGTHQGIEPHRVSLPRPRGEPGATRHPDEDGRLGDVFAQLSGAVELPDPARQRESERAGGQAESRG